MKINITNLVASPSRSETRGLDIYDKYNSGKGFIFQKNTTIRYVEQFAVVLHRPRTPRNYMAELLPSISPAPFVKLSFDSRKKTNIIEDVDYFSGLSNVDSDSPLQR